MMVKSRFGGGRLRTRTAMVAVAASLLAACGGGGGTGESADDTISIGTTLAPTTLDPQVGTSGADYQYLYFLFDRLIQFDPMTGELKPMLATSWEFVGEDKLELRVTLREGVTFHDGTPLNAEAVVFTLERHIENGDVVNNLQFVDDIEAVGEHEVAIHLSQQNAQLPYGLASRAGMIVSPAAVEEAGDQDFGGSPVGTGPYRFVSQKAGTRYVFTRYDDYWDNANLRRVNGIEFQIFKNDSTLVTAVRTGEIQVAGNVFPQNVDLLKQEQGLEVAVGQGPAFNLVYFNGSLEPFDDRRVRLAFNLALDREAIMKAATEGHGKVRHQPVPPDTPGYVPELDPLWERDVARAKQLMAEAGYPNGVDVNCYTYPGLGYDITGPIIIDQMRQIGIRMKISAGTPAQVVPFYNEDLAPCYLSGWSGGANPVTTYTGILWSESYYNAGKTGFGVDRYIDRFFTTYTESGRQDLFAKINETMRTKPGYAPLYANPSTNVYHESVKGWRISPYNLNNWQGLHYADG